MIINMQTKEVFTIRELMPSGYTNILQKRTKRKQSYITKVVTKEITTSPIWPAVLQLAEETKPLVLAEQKRLQEEQQRLEELKSKPAA